MPFSGRQLLAGWAVGFSLGAFAFGAEVYRPTNSQPIGEPLSPREAVGRLHAPPGFKITLAASEPDVQQPIAIAYDDRGRLWVAECYSYAGSNFTEEKRDRILIFEDTDGDGIFDSRKVFHDHLNRLTGLAIGFGGVWVTTAPTLSFIPDRNCDDIPDGEPVALLDGWTMDAEHNTVNGLSWGPDGWLYGRHGIKNSSLVGPPGAPASGRTMVSCGIWRFHPTRRVFEVVADGTIIVTREDGQSSVLAWPAATGGEAKLLGEGMVDEMTVATPVCIDGRVLLRTHDSLWCIGGK